MPSKAYASFTKNVEDVEQLLSIHTHIGGGRAGRKWGLEVLNKSAIVLITAFWEAYCEDIAAEGLAHLVKHAKNADALPTELKQLIAAELKKSPHDLEVWKIAGGGWRKILTDRLAALKVERDRKVNTPKTAQITQLFHAALGIKDVSKEWRWKGMSSTRAAAKLDAYVELRGAIAHRGNSSKSVTKADVSNFLAFASELVNCTGGAVNWHMTTAIGVNMW